MLLVSKAAIVWLIQNTSRALRGFLKCHFLTFLRDCQLVDILALHPCPTIVLTIIILVFLENFTMISNNKRMLEFDVRVRRKMSVLFLPTTAQEETCIFSVGTEKRKQNDQVAETFCKYIFVCRLTFSMDIQDACYDNCVWKWSEYCRIISE